MNYIDEIFFRGDIQQIREFLLHGVEGEVDPRAYKERAESAHKRLAARLLEACPDEKEYEKMTEPVYDYVRAIEAVYMEIGLQLGARLAAQAFQNLKTPSEEE